MDVPSTAEIELWSKVDFANLDSPFLEADLDVVVPRAAAYIVQVTGRTFDDSFPLPLIPLCEEAMQYRVEQMCFQAQADSAEEASDELVHNFSAGQYSETRQDLAPAGPKGGGIPMINSNPALNRLLWLIMTDDMRSYWWALITGLTVPAFEVTEVDWNNYDGLYPYTTGHILDDPTTWGA